MLGYKRNLQADYSTHDEVEEDLNNKDDSKESSGNIYIKYFLWNHFKDMAMQDDEIKENIRKNKKALIDVGENKKKAEREAFRVVLPAVKEKIYEYYSNFLLLSYCAEEDGPHEIIMHRRRKLMCEKKYGVEEAIQCAINNNKDLIQEEIEYAITMNIR